LFFFSRLLLKVLILFLHFDFTPKAALFSLSLCCRRRHHHHHVKKENTIRKANFDSSFLHFFIGFIISFKINQQIKRNERHCIGYDGTV